MDVLRILGIMLALSAIIFLLFKARDMAEKYRSSGQSPVAGDGVVRTASKDRLAKVYGHLALFFEDVWYTNQESYEVFLCFRDLCLGVSRAIAQEEDPFPMTIREFVDHMNSAWVAPPKFLRDEKAKQLVLGELGDVKIQDLILVASDLMSAQIDPKWNKERTLDLFTNNGQ